MDPVHQRLGGEQSFLESDCREKGCYASEKYPDAEVPREELLQGSGLAQCYPVMSALTSSSQISNYNCENTSVNFIDIRNKSDIYKVENKIEEL